MREREKRLPSKRVQTSPDLADTIFLRRSSRRPLVLLLRVSLLGCRSKEGRQWEYSSNVILVYFRLYIDAREFSRCHLPLNTGDARPMIFRKWRGIPSWEPRNCSDLVGEYNPAQNMSGRINARLSLLKLICNIFRKYKNLWSIIDFEFLPSPASVNLVHVNSFVRASVFSVACWMANRKTVLIPVFEPSSCDSGSLF